MIGRRTPGRSHINGIQEGVYNCAAFVIGIHNKWLQFDYRRNWGTINNQDALRQWISYYRNDLGVDDTTPSLRNDEQIEIFKVAVEDNLIIKENEHEYQPQLYDIAVYFHSLEANVNHVAIYADFDEPLELELGNRWYSKCGQEYLVAHGLQRMDSNFIKAELVEYDRLDFRRVIEALKDGDTEEDPITIVDLSGDHDAMGKIFNTEGYDILSYIIRGNS